MLPFRRSASNSAGCVSVAPLLLQPVDLPLHRRRAPLVAGDASDSRRTPPASCACASLSLAMPVTSWASPSKDARAALTARTSYLHSVSARDPVPSGTPDPRGRPAPALSRASRAWPGSWTSSQIRPFSALVTCPKLGQTGCCCGLAACVVTAFADSAARWRLRRHPPDRRPPDEQLLPGAIRDTVAGSAALRPRSWPALRWICRLRPAAARSSMYSRYGCDRRQSFTVGLAAVPAGRTYRDLARRQRRDIHLKPFSHQHFAGFAWPRPGRPRRGRS